MYIAQYKSHANKTLHYMGYTLYRINQTERAFGDACQTNAMIWMGKNGNFNFPKWHVMSDYPK